MSQFISAVTGYGSFTGSFYLTDLFDVLVIAVFFYAALLLFKKTRSLPILVGIGVVIILYGLSQFFSLTLTSAFLQSFFGAFFLILIIIFQEEIRRFFESISVLGSRQQKERSISLKNFLLDPIIQAITNLASHKVGALIVFTGHENLERHLEGETYLDGLISQTLIESIFDSSSPGHDGAMVITNNRIAVVGAQLPLSRNFQEIGKGGTRHAAALGLAEKSDALIVVVSEERGTISVTQNGELKKLDGAEELASILRKFYKEKYPTQSESVWKRVLIKNLTEKVSAIVLAGALWFFLVFQAGNIRRSYEVPISYRDLAENLVVEDSKDRLVIVTLESRGQSFDQLDINSLNLSVDARDFKSGDHTIHITDSMIRKPFAFDIININPPEINIHVNEYSLADLPIKADIIGTVAPGRRIQQVVITPRNLPVLISDGLERTPLSISTNPIDVTGLQSTVSRQATFSLPSGVRFQNNSSIDVAVTIVIRNR
ncbi:MAG: diadenylate cyclase [bacterium]|nr:diadenylate cyclase [bacterium]